MLFVSFLFNLFTFINIRIYILLTYLDLLIFYRISCFIIFHILIIATLPPILLPYHFLLLSY